MLEHFTNITRLVELEKNSKSINSISPVHHTEKFLLKHEELFALNLLNFKV